MIQFTTTCHTSYLDPDDKSIVVTKNKSYNVIYNDHKYQLITDGKRTVNLSHYTFNLYFYTQEQIRQFKLNSI